MPPLDDDRCYAAAASRDARFDGSFVTAVRTTGIYCRPSCPAITPKRTNVEFHPTAAAAQQRGFRACKRCRPDATPGSPEWNVRQDVVGRAMRLIADGAIERIGVPGLARRLGYSERHLNRLLTSEVGAGPLALARAQRAQTARVLIETTDMRLTDVAFAAGFGSVRQFNDTIREVYATSPSALRAAARSGSGARSAAGGDGGPDAGSVSVTLRLAVRPPFPYAVTLAFVGRRAIDGVESFRRLASPDGDVVRYRRLLTLPNGPGVMTLDAPVGRPDDDAGVRHVVVAFDLTAVADLAVAVQRVRRMLDLDADPVAIDGHLASTRLADAVRAVPGRRSPTGADPFETLVRAIVGQQISVAGARTVTGRLATAAGTVTALAGDDLRTTFPDADALADAPDDAFSMPAGRRDTIRRVAAAVADGSLPLDAGSDPVEVRVRLLEVRGIGPWTADYVLLRGLGHPDVFLGGDLGVRQAARRHGWDDLADASSAWAPWRSYATHHLWGALDAPPTNQEA